MPGLLAAATLLLASCAPFPPVVRGPEATRSVFMPAVIEAREDVSPLPQSSPAAAAQPSLTPAADSGAEGSGLEGAAWRWRASTFEDGTTLAPGDPSRYTVEFLPDGNALVQADCNFGAGLYQVEGDALSIGAIGATKMACPPDSLDSAFLAQLGHAERFAIEGDELILWLQEAAGEMRLVSERPALPTAAPATATALPPTPAPTETPPPAPTRTPTETPEPPTATATEAAPPTAVPTVPLPMTPTATPLPSPAPALPTPAQVDARGVIWTMTALSAGGEMRAPVGVTAATLEISPDGQRVGGSTGCNEYRAGVTLDEDAIQFAGVALLTRTACDWPVMLQEVELVDALLRAMFYSADAGELVLLGQDREVLAVFARK
jgi:heat shock protein HslJ